MIPVHSLFVYTCMHLFVMRDMNYNSLSLSTISLDKEVEFCALNYFWQEVNTCHLN